MGELFEVDGTCDIVVSLGVIELLAICLLSHSKGLLIVSQERQLILNVCQLLIVFILIRILCPRLHHIRSSRGMNLLLSPPSRSLEAFIEVFLCMFYSLYFWLLLLVLKAVREEVW